MKVITVGSRVFVTSFQLAGVQGKIADTPENALKEIKEIYKDPEAGLILLSDDLSKPIGMKKKLINNQKLKEFGWKHKTSLEDGIKQTYEYFLKMNKK